jgi:hypothetical protein
MHRDWSGELAGACPAPRAASGQRVWMLGRGGLHVALGPSDAARGTGGDEFGSRAQGVAWSGVPPSRTRGSAVAGRPFGCLAASGLGVFLSGATTVRRPPFRSRPGSHENVRRDAAAVVRAGPLAGCCGACAGGRGGGRPRAEGDRRLRVGARRRGQAGDATEGDRLARRAGCAGGQRIPEEGTAPHAGVVVREQCRRGDRGGAAAGARGRGVRRADEGAHADGGARRGGDGDRGARRCCSPAPTRRSPASKRATRRSTAC